MDNECKSVIFVNESNATQNEEVNLPEVMASLKILSVDMPVDTPEEVEVSQSNPRRSLRKKVPRNLDYTTYLKRRVSSRPKKRSLLEMESEEQIKEYYLDKTVKRHTNSLETIFEEREDSSQSANTMSAKRFKRMIQFNKEPTDSKLKKRKDKIRKVFGSKINHRKRKNVSMQALLDKLSGLQNDISINNGTK